MSAKYVCDACYKKVTAHYNKFKEHEFVGDHICVRFIVDFNQWTDRDICIPCALRAIQTAAKQLRKKV